MSYFHINKMILKLIKGGKKVEPGGYKNVNATQYAFENQNNWSFTDKTNSIKYLSNRR